MKLRQEFLETHWIAYPEIPQAASICGRITDLNEKEISVDGEPYALDLLINLKPVHQLHQVSLYQLVEILKPQDQVALELHEGKINTIWLLAPSLVAPLNLKSDAAGLTDWRKFINSVRHFFEEKSFLEVSTPTLVDCPGTEPFLDLFSVVFQSGQIRQKYYLPTSPELHLKKMLAAGHRKIFEMRPCFRNGEVTEHHQPEFWMLEWYRAYDNLKTIMQDTKELVQKFSATPLEFEEKSMRQLFKEKLDFDLTPQTSIGELKNLAIKHGMQVENFDLWDDVFYFIFVEKIEHKLGVEKPLFVTDYPPSQAALARLTADGWGDRFELYWGGLEIANAFHELNDPKIQRARFQEDLDKKKSLDKEVPPLDQEFLKALDSGFPPSGGIALGLERLFMASQGLQTIEKTRAFPLVKNT